MAFKTVAVISLGFLGAVLFVQQPVTGIIGGIAIGSVISQSLQMPAIVRRDLGLTSSQFRDQFLVRPSVVVAVPGLGLGRDGLPRNERGGIASRRRVVSYGVAASHSMARDL